MAVPIDKEKQLPPDSILVKDVDGTFKVLADGMLKDIDAILASSQTTPTLPKQETVEPEKGGPLALPTFRDLAVIPHDVQFKEPILTPDAKGTKEHQFHPEDTQDIERELEKVRTAYELTPQKRYSIEKIATKLIDKHQLSLNEDLTNRFVKILMSFFRQARSVVETKTVLQETASSNGIGASAEVAEHIVTVAKTLKERIEAVDGIVISESSIEARTPDGIVSAAHEQTKLEPTPPVSEVKQDTPMQPQEMTGPMSIREALQRGGPPVHAAMPPVPLPQEKREPPPPDMMVRPVTEPPKEPEPSPTSLSSMMSMDGSPARSEVTQAKPATEPVKSQVTDTSKLEEKQPTTESAQPIIAQSYSTPKVVRAQPASTVVDDVKRSAPLPRSREKVMGRVEELGAMDLDTWRMLDENPRIRAGKILGKIQNLEQESLTRKSQGIDAWRSSEIYQLYLNIGQKSLEQRKDVVQVIQGMTASSTATLTLDEFEAISDLNRTLRY